MTTALNIITDALELIGIYGPGDQLSAADANKGLSVLNDMMDSWSNESLACFANSTQSFPLVVNQSQYTVGPGGNINGTRPLRVIDAPGSAYLLDQFGNNYPMNVDDLLNWNITTTAAVNSNLPDHMYYDPQYPLGIINIWPIPNETYTCYFTSYLQLSDLASLTSEFSMPPGYKRAITTNLAISLKPYFTAAALDPDIRLEAMQSKAAVKRTNMRTQIATYDPEIISRGSSTYNIRTDRNY